MFLPELAVMAALVEVGGKADDARRMLRRVRGTDDVDDEYHDLTVASEVFIARGVTSCGRGTGRSS